MGIVDVNDEQFGRSRGYDDRDTPGLGKVAYHIATLEEKISD